jgi:nitrogen fixation/metabolism regulation signal transduction histidine kinase
VTRNTRLAWVVALVSATGVAGVVAFLLSGGGGGQRGFFDRHYVWLFWVNLGVASLLALVILAALVNLVLRMRRGRFGSQLLFKLATVFGLVGVVPGVLIYAVSYQFLNRTIETWFDVKLASALEAGLNLGRGTLDNLVTDLGRTRRATS